MRSAYRILVGYIGRKRPLGRLRNRWKDFKCMFRKLCWGVDRICMPQDRDLGNMVMIL
jgi:hypothetical protein